MKGRAARSRFPPLCLFFFLLLLAFCILESRFAIAESAEEADSAPPSTNAEEGAADDSDEESLGEDEDDDEDEDDNLDASSLFGSLGFGAGLGGDMESLSGLSELFDNLGGGAAAGGNKNLGNLASLLPAMGTIGRGAGDDKEDLAELLSKAAAQQNSGTKQVSADFMNQIFSMISKNNTALNDIMTEFMQDPYMDVKEIERPVIDPQVFANAPDTDVTNGKAEHKDEAVENTSTETLASPAAMVEGPKEIVLSKIKEFVKKPEDDQGRGAGDQFGETNEDAAVCHVLVLSGGGAKSAFQAGAVVGLAEQYKAQGRKLKWDVLAGVGFGGVQAAFGLPFKPGQNGELDYGASLWRFWQGLKPDDLLHCENGMRDLMDIRATMNWIQKSQKYATNVTKMLKVPLPHPCDTSRLAATLRSQISQLAIKGIGAGEACDTEEPRLAVITASKLGGGRHSWTLLPSHLETDQCKSEEDSSCRVTQASPEDPGSESRTPLMLAMEATTASPGTFPPVAFKNGKGKLEGFVDGAVNSFLSVVPALTACQERVKHSAKNPFSDEEIAQGKGIALDFVLTVEADKPNTEGTVVEEDTESDDDLFDNTGIPLENIAVLKEKFPALTIRHVVAPEDSYELAHDLMDLRSIQALLELGRVAGWGAQVYESAKEDSKYDEA